jgi:hypothetical protein
MINNCMYIYIYSYFLAGDNNKHTYTRLIHAHEYTVKVCVYTLQKLILLDFIYLTLWIMTI